MRLSLNDGYTLSAKTSVTFTDGVREWSNLPVVSFDYRPALPDAIYEWQMRTTRALTGKEQLDAAAELLAGHLTKWDVTDKSGTNAQLTPDTVRRVPYPIFQQLITRVTTWAAQAGEDAKN